MGYSGISMDTVRVWSIRTALLALMTAALMAVLVIVGTRPASAATCEIGGTPVITVVSQAECDALIALYASTDGPNWNDNTGWTTPTDPCDWYGITCDATGVTNVGLYSNKLSGPIPAAIGGLTNLTHLSLTNNKVSSIPAEIGNLTNLLQLNINMNWGIAPIPAEIGSLTNLTRLDASHDGLSSIPVEIGQLTSLTLLLLSSNQLTAIPVEIGNLTNLTYLQLPRNQLASIPSEIGNFTNLTTLNLSGNQLTSLLPEIGNLDSLTSLDVMSNALSGDVTVAMAGIRDTVTTLGLADGGGGNNCLAVTDPDLAAWLTVQDPGWDECQSTSCTIDGTPVTTFVPQAECDALIAFYTSTDGPNWTNNTGWNTPTDPCGWYGVGCGGYGVQSLSFGWANGIAGPVPAEIGNLSSLTNLYIVNNDLTSIPPEIGNLASLTSLYLDQNELTSIPPEIGNLSNLVGLGFRSNQLTSIPPEIGNLASLKYLFLQYNMLSGDITVAMNGVRDTLATLELADGLAMNNCLTVTDPDLATWLTVQDPGWDDCQSMSCTIDGTSVTTVASQPECDALVAFYTSTDGPNWNDNTGWITATDPCDWHGVTCGLDGVTHLYLSTNNLSGPVPAEIGDLSNLLALGVSYNQVSSLPAEIGDLSSLLGLYLSGTGLSSYPTEIGNLTGLTSLSLSSNHLTSVPPEIWSLTNLTGLSLDRNDLTSISPEIGSLTKLTSLALLFNDLSSIPDELGDLDSLETLYLNYNQLSGDITVPMSGLQDTVTKLYLADDEAHNNCLTVTDSDLADWLTSESSGWDACELVLSDAGSVVLYDPVGGGVSVVDVGAGGGFTPPSVSGVVSGADMVGTAYLGGPDSSVDDILFYSSVSGRFQFASVTAPDGAGHRGLDVFVDVPGTTGWTHVVTGDYNGDGVGDVLFYRARDGLMRFYTTSASGGFVPLTPVMWGTRDWSHLVVGDFNGDGSDDVLWYRARDGLMRFYEVTDAGLFKALTPAYFGTRNWTTIPAGDYDGNGVDDVMFYRGDGVARFYEVDGGVFRALGAMFTPAAGYTQIEGVEFTPATLGVDLAWYHAGVDLLAGTRYDVDGVVNLWDPMSTSSYGDTLIIATGTFPQ